MSYIIQNSVYPSFSLCSEKELYFRTNDNVDINMADKVITLKRKGKLWTDTYFNSVSVGKWKRYTNVNDLILNLSFKGKIKITFHLNRLHFSSRVLNEFYLENTNIGQISIPLIFWKEIEDGMLYFEIEASSTTIIEDFNYSTNTPISNHIKLGMVITHFNRQQYVLPAVERLKEGLLNLSQFKGKVSLYIVDNSKNLPSIDDVTIIPNANLGGAGGFTRGLLKLKESGEYTHCLFMDDDASCEVEGIRRTIALLEFAKTSDTAIAGAMLREAEMYRQFENGARFDGVCKPNKSNFDLRDRHLLLVNELDERIDYGGWWFFAFPLNIVKHYAFPYFVRGDDSGFSLIHNFNIMTLNGISSWQEDFALKNGPLPHYLDTRYHLMHQLHGLVPSSKKALMLTAAKMCLRNLLTYQYETALATIYAMEDVAKGKTFWEQNVDMSSKRPEIQKIISAEKIVDIPLNISASAVGGNAKESKICRLVRLLSLNGHLLPSFLMKKETVWQHKGFGGHLREVYRYQKVLYIHWPTQKGFVIQQDKKKFFSYLTRYIKASYQLYKNYDKLKSEYQNSYDECTSKEFWNKQFKQD